MINRNKNTKTLQVAPIKESKGIDVNTLVVPTSMESAETLLSQRILQAYREKYQNDTIKDKDLLNLIEQL